MHTEQALQKSSPLHVASPEHALADRLSASPGNAPGTRPPGLPACPFLRHVRAALRVAAVWRHLCPCLAAPRALPFACITLCLQEDLDKTSCRPCMTRARAESQSLMLHVWRWPPNLSVPLWAAYTQSVICRACDVQVPPPAPIMPQPVRRTPKSHRARHCGLKVGYSSSQESIMWVRAALSLYSCCYTAQACYRTPSAVKESISY